jgi:hypothetical protein
METRQEQVGVFTKSGGHPTTNIAPRRDLAQSKVGPPLLADPEDPMHVSRSHLEKMEIGKSSSSCKVSLVTRLHRTAVLQEYWCASFEEAQVYENLAANSNVLNFKEQLMRVDFVTPDGSKSHTKVDLHVLLRNSAELLVSIKYDEKARRPSYLAEVADIAAQCSPEIADSFAVMSRYHFHPAWRECARKIHLVRRGWDPEADCTVLNVARGLPESFTLGELVKAAGLDSRGWRAAIRLIGDGDIYKHPLDRFENDLICRRAA